MVRLRRVRYLVPILIVAILASSFPSRVRADSPCGMWDGAVSDQRIKLTRISGASGDDCHGAFLFGNDTGISLLGGGYTLEVSITRFENAKVAWITTQDTTNGVVVLPSLPLELHAIPLDASSNARISAEAAMTLRAVAVDTSFFLLKTALAFVPGKSCVVPDEQLSYTAARLAYIVAPAADAALKGDLLGARQELEQVLPEFLRGATGALREIGVDCGLELILGEPASIAKLVLAYVLWVPVVIFDYFKYQGQPAYASFTYTPPIPAPTSTAIPIPTPTKSPATATGRIAFVSTRDGNNQIYMMNADGSAQTRLTNNTTSDGNWDWSPDGLHIAFVSNRDGNNEIYVMNSDGSSQTRLTNDSARDGSPVWSPDGRRIAFDSDRGLIEKGALGASAYYEIYVMNSDGSGLTRLTNNTHFDSSPDWSPDGLHIAFVSSRDSPNEIYVMNSDGTSQTNLTNNPGIDTSPVWSPDGQRIAFTSNRDGNYEIYVMNSDGTSQTNLTNNPASDSSPAWSPDGLRIAFTSNRDGNFEIYVMNSDGSGQTRLTDNLAWDGNPAWSP